MIAESNNEPAIKIYEAPKPPVVPFKYPTKYEPAKEPKAPKLFIKAIAPAVTLAGNIYVIIAKKGP